MAHRILLVEDELHLAFNMTLNLEAEGYEVVHAANGTTAIQLYREQGPFSMILLDVMLPEMDGYEVAKWVRTRDKRTGILMLTARASGADRIAGLESGADDYIAKPFHLQELLLRIKRMTERAELLQEAEELQEEHEKIEVGSIALDVFALELRVGARLCQLTALEAELLKELMMRPGEVLSREHLLKNVWGLQGQQETRTVDNFMMRLRRHIESDPKNPRYIESVRGRGYRFNPDTPEI